jgi:hypothetical protein
MMGVPAGKLASPRDFLKFPTLVLLAPAEAGKSSNHFGHVRRDAVPAHDILTGSGRRAMKDRGSPGKQVWQIICLVASGSSARYIF